MAQLYDICKFYVDFSKSTLLNDDEKRALEKIQELYRPVERAEFLTEYRIQGKITDDEYETMTGLPYKYGGF